MKDLAEYFKQYDEYAKMMSSNIPSDHSYRKNKKKKYVSSEWTKHTKFHWSKTVKGERLDYWPTKKKFMYKKEVMVGNVHDFIKNL